MLSFELDPVLRFASEHRQLIAPIVALLVGYLLYGVLGTRYLGPDDDYWESIRARALPIVDSIARSRGLYAETDMHRSAYVGSVRMTANEFERTLLDARYLRQPLSSLHYAPDGRTEDGSWSRPTGPLFPISEVLRRHIPLSTFPGRSVRAIDSILALKQIHVVFFADEVDGEPVIDVYTHREYNPLNPLVAPHHYGGVGLDPGESVTVEHLEQRGIEVFRRPGLGLRSAATDPRVRSAADTADRSQTELEAVENE